MKRREFIILTSIGATLSACGNPENKLIPALIPDEEYVPGLDYWKATSCAMCQAGCGLLVRTREHKANKIEGNPQHPVNRGSLCARGQAAVQSLYNPDRIEGPLRRAGERGSGRFENISWEEAFEELTAKLGEIKSRKESVGLLTGDASGVTGLAAEILASSLDNGRLIDAHGLNDLWIRAGYENAYHQPIIPSFDIANARYLISFGARFLETWRSPVSDSLAFGEFRGAATRGKFVQVEPRMSLTAANADEWLPAAVGTESMIALALAQVIVREGLSKIPIQQNAFSLDDYAPEKTESATGIGAEKIIRIAREFASSQPALAIGSGTSVIERQADAEAGLKRIEALHLLNKIAGNEEKSGGVLLSPPGIDPLAKWRGKGRWLPLTGKSISGLSALLIHQSNPVFTTPHTADAIKSAPFIVSFSSFPDETSQIADLVLPDHTWLEGWNIKAAPSVKSGAVVNLTQPVVSPQLNTKQTADALLAVARSLGISPPFENAEEMTQQAASEIAKVAGATDAEEFRASFTERGFWTGKPGRIKGESTPKSSSSEVIDEVASLAKQGHASEFPFILLTYEHPSLGFGNQANLPALQELPDPMTGVIWGSWVEINPQTANKLGVADGDLVEVETPHGSLKAPAVVYAAIRPEVIAMPFGQGHASMGRYAENRGANPATINPVAAALLSDTAAVRAKITKLSEQAGLIRFGTTLPERPHIKR